MRLCHIWCCCNLKIRSAHGFSKINRVFGPLWPFIMRALGQNLAMFGKFLAARKHHFNRQGNKIRRQDKISPAPRSNTAQFAFKPEMCGGINRRHLQRDQRLAAAVNCVAHHPIHMPLIDQGLRVTIISA